MSTRPGVKNLRVATGATPSDYLGSVLDARFRLDEIVSEGGMGIVYKATQLSVCRCVAVKVIRPELAQNAGLVTRFSVETEVIGRLSHPNIVQLIDAGSDRGLSYLAMEFVEGVTFRSALQRTTLSLLEILFVFVQVCDALSEAHDLGIIHRDLKFDNIMLCRHQNRRLHVKVLDFGVARQLEHDQRLTKSGEVPGTPGIIAPELVEQADPSAQSDLYSLGVLMFTALTGRAPFSGQNDYEVMRAHAQDDVPNIYELVGDRVPEVVLDLARELMEKDPSLRPDSAVAVRDRLEKIIRQLERQMMDHPRYVPPARELIRPLQPPESPRGERSDDFIAENEGEERLRSQPERPPVAPMSVVALLIALVILLSLAVIYLLFRQYTGGG